MTEDPSATGRHVLMAFYSGLEEAEGALRRLLAADFPMDRISLLGRCASSGDDPLGVYYESAGERMKGWGRMGAFWGGLWGLVTGAAGMFLLPGLGPLMAAGPVVQALAGAAGGAAVTGGLMAGAGAASQLAVGVHRMGVPEERLDETRDLLAEGRHLVMLILADREVEQWRAALQDTGPSPLWAFPYVGVGQA